MKTLAFALLCLAACSSHPGGNKKPTTGTTGDGTPCTQEIALVCPEGQIDACLKAVADQEAKTKAKDAEMEDSGGTGTAMALDEGRMATLENAGTHRCVPK